MGFETLTHTPEFELPSNAPPAPADLISLIEECYEGLSKAIVWKMLRRNKYDQVATIICQDNPSKKTTPIASAEDIADYCMMTMQYEMDKSDDPGTYKVQLLGPPGRGRFDRSKHIDLSGGEGEAHSKTMLSEGELVEQQSSYIGELHSQMIAMHETLHSMVKPLLQENKEMMRIVTEAARKNAEMERDRLRHELEMMMHRDDMKQQEQIEELKNERFKETMKVIEESGAIEGLMKVLHKKLANSDKKDDSSEDEESTSKKKDNKASSNGDEESNEQYKKERAKRKIRKRIKGNIKKASEGEELSVDQLQEVFRESGMKKAEENPTALLVEILKMSIDEKDQWGMLEETLTEDQFKLFKKISESDSDPEIEKMLKELYNMKGMRRFFKLEEHLDEDQKKWIDKLLEIAVQD